MKLIVVASTFPAGETDPVPAFVKDQLIALKGIDPGMQISVLAPHDRRSATRDFSSRETYDEYRFHYFWPRAAEKLAGRGIMATLKSNPLTYLLLPFLFLGEFFALLKLTRRLRPDVIYAHWFTPQAIIAAWVSRTTGTPFVFTTHASDADVWRKVPILGRYLVRSTAIRARAFTAVSRRSMQKLERFFPAEDWKSMEARGRIIPMGVNLPELFPDRSGSPARKTILFMGRLVEKKGVHHLLPAFAKARHAMADCTLVIAGDGPMMEGLKAQASKLHLGNEEVRFAGFRSGADKSRLLEEAHVHVVPSIVAADGDAEGLPVSLLEGMAHGRVCIATADSGADDLLVDGYNGFVVPGGDVDALAAALIRAAQLTPQERLAISSAARQAACEFDWSTVARRHYDFLIARPHQ